MREIHSADDLARALRTDCDLALVIQGVDLEPFADELEKRDVRGLVVLGAQCDRVAGDLVRRGATVFGALPEIPYELYRTALYTPEELYAGFDPGDPATYGATLDARIYAHWGTNGKERPEVLESLAQRLHDHAITQAKLGWLEGREDVVAFMGGHSMKRDEPAYARVVGMAQELARRGYTLVSGGGPGAMEACNLGAYLARASEEETREAIEVLAEAPSYRDARWLAQAFRVRAQHPSAHCESLGIPTWLYGHEPPNPFATKVAKLFQNSVREEGLVTVATRGIVFAPGSAGTVQEIFQDATQNHYGTVRGIASPMAFLGKAYWEERLPVVPLLRKLSEGRRYAELIEVEDDPARLIAWLDATDPREA